MCANNFSVKLYSLKSLCMINVFDVWQVKFLQYVLPTIYIYIYILFNNKIVKNLNSYLKNKAVKILMLILLALI